MNDEERPQYAVGQPGWPPPPPVSSPPPPPPDGALWGAPPPAAWAGAAAPATAAPVSRDGVRSLATWTVGLLYAVVVGYLVSLVAMFATDAGRELMTYDGSSLPTFGGGEVALLLLSMVHGVVGIALIVVFLIWMHRCHVQLTALRGPDALPYGSALAVWSWFIPLANLVMPLLEVRGLFRASAAEDQDAAPPTYVYLWWTALAVVPTILMVLGLGDTWEAFRAGMRASASGTAQFEPTTASLIRGVLNTASLAVAGLLAVKLVRDLTGRVDRVAERAGVR